MRNWLKYPPLQLRYSDAYCVPSGPNFTFVRRFNGSIDQTAISLKVPPHSYLHPNAHYETRNLDSACFGKLYKHEMPDEAWRYTQFLFRCWYFYGPWFSGMKVSMNISVRCYTPTKPFSEGSFFHPNIFESALSAFLNSLRGHKRVGGTDKPYFVGPVNWQPITGFSMPAVRYEVMRSEYAGLAEPVTEFAFPVADNIFALVTISYAQHVLVQIEEIDKHIDQKPIKNLINNILDSLVVTLSPDAQAQLDAVKAYSKNMSLSPTFAPLKWPVGEPYKDPYSRN